MGFAYSNDGLSYRAVSNDMPLAPGEVLFEDTPTAAELQSAFPNYSTAIAGVQSQQAPLTNDEIAAIRVLLKGGSK